MEIVAREAKETGCTFNISMFFAGRNKLIVYGHEVILDPEGDNPPKIGPDPSRIKKLTEMQPPTTVKGVRSLLGLVNQLRKFCSDYAMNTTKLRGLLYKNAKFCWTDAHQAEFDHVMETLGSLEHLHPYKEGNEMFALTDASVSGLGFILFQRDSNGKQSILQVGSTCLKNAQARWHPTELELLDIQYCLTKCHF